MSIAPLLRAQKESARILSENQENGRNFLESSAEVQADDPDSSRNGYSVTGVNVALCNNVASNVAPCNNVAPNVASCNNVARNVAPCNNVAPNVASCNNVARNVAPCNNVALSVAPNISISQFYEKFPLPVFTFLEALEKESVGNDLLEQDKTY